MHNLIKLFAVIFGITLGFILSYVYYMNASSGYCVTHLPARVLIDETPPTYFNITTNCKGGRFFQPSKLELNLTKYYNIN